MSYSRRPQYKTMREKNNEMKRRLKVGLIIVVIAAIIYAYMNRLHISEYISSF